MANLPPLPNHLLPLSEQEQLVLKQLVFDAYIAWKKEGFQEMSIQAFIMYAFAPELRQVPVHFEASNTMIAVNAFFRGYKRAVEALRQEVTCPNCEMGFILHHGKKDHCPVCKGRGYITYFEILPR